MTAVGTTRPASRSRANRAARVLRLAIIVLGPAVNLVMQSIGQLATPIPYRPEIAWTTLHAAVPIVFAVCAIIASRVGEPPLPIAIMIAISYLWIPQTFFTVLAPFGNIWPLVRSIELVWALLLGMLALAYPSGRFHGRVDRAIVGVGIGISIVRMVAVVLIDEPNTLICKCAANPYAIVEDSGVFTQLDLAYRIAGAVIVLVIAGRMFRKWVRSSSPARTVAFVMPIGLTAWTLALVTEAISYALTRQETGSLVVATANQGPVSIVSLFAVVSVPICYVAGTVHLRNTRGRVADLMRITRDGADRAAWRASLASTLRDPGLEVYWWDAAAGRYLDEDGATAELPSELPGEVTEATKTLLPISAGDGTRIAVIRHDRALAENQRLLDGVSTALGLAVDNGKLRSEVERTLDQVRESRQRIVEAGDEARKRLERNLHDGSQQQLVALAMELRTICTSARASGNDDLADELERVLSRLSAALRELRELARGIHPTVLVEGGLALALPELASRCPIPVEVVVEVPDRMPELVESTAYFAASECLVNIARHSGARRAWLKADVVDEHLRLVLRDDGIGGADTENGTGITGLVDRVEAVGGTLTFRSPRGEGTTVTVGLPLELDEPAIASRD